MQNIILIIVALLVGAGGYFMYTASVPDIDSQVTELQNEAAAPESAEETDDAFSLENGPSVQPISHASMVLSWAGKTIYVDPVGETSAYTDLMAPDLVLLTDVHGDHLSVETLTGIIAGDTLIVVPQAVYDELTPQQQTNAVILANNEMTELLGFTLTATPMYNYPETEDSRHEKGRGNGYIIGHNDFQTYIAGDTGPAPELRELTGIDLAFVPMNLPYTMGVADAADLVADFAPTVVVPFHYRNQDGTYADLEQFKELLQTEDSNIQVLELDWYPDREESEAVVEVEVSEVLENDVVESSDEDLQVQ